MERYIRQIVLPEIGEEGQEKLQRAKVLVVGCGGLGCPALQYLVGAGVGKIGLVDFDRVSLSNLHRQILYKTSDVGQPKAEVARKALLAQNPDITIDAITQRLTTDNVLDLVKDYDLVIDGTDNFPTRYLINDACLLLGKPMVYGAIYKFEGQVAVFNFNKSASYRCLFPQPPQAGTVPNCSEIGVLGVLPGLIGTLQANEALKIILGIGEVLAGKLFTFNALSCQSVVIGIKANPHIFDEWTKRKTLLPASEYAEFCSPDEQLVSVEAVFNLPNPVLIDVRESSETPMIALPGLLRIPLKDLENQWQRLPDDADKVFFCQSGLRSRKALALAENKGLKNCYSLCEGAPVLAQYLHTALFENKGEKILRTYLENHIHHEKP